jgi:hypothetical protein
MMKLVVHESPPGVIDFAYSMSFGSAPGPMMDHNPVLAPVPHAILHLAPVHDNAGCFERKTGFSARRRISAKHRPHRFLPYRSRVDADFGASLRSSTDSPPKLSASR